MHLLTITRDSDRKHDVTPESVPSDSVGCEDYRLLHKGSGRFITVTTTGGTRIQLVKWFLNPEQSQQDQIALLLEVADTYKEKFTLQEAGTHPIDAIFFRVNPGDDPDIKLLMVNRPTESE